MLALPLGVDLDTPALYVAHISLSEFGASLTLPCVTGNEQVNRMGLDLEMHCVNFQIYEKLLSSFKVVLVHALNFRTS